MARSHQLVSSIINTTSRREFSTYKFSLAKLSRNQAPSSGETIKGVDHQESPSEIVGSSLSSATSTTAGSASQRPATAWWGPDPATGVWGPASGSEVQLLDAAGVHHFEQPWFREDVHQHPHPSSV